ncbi:hypothetical protein V9T40_007850 [Parthenolecanium corni]|uniref:MutL C-terminal dimerisation domain-containing protein n=1 Tax=Parthenolecanium corni TaxID=536013 RepID=A0AAN9TIE4_9HEMI
MSNSAIIMPIGGEAVHKICPEQVVLSLAVALKELLENSLDAGASAVDLRLREYSSELIEVVDNGIGIHPNNFEALGKLRSNIRLPSVESWENPQKLVVPQELNLTSINECVLRDNLDVLRTNGFEFSINDSAEVNKKVKLTSTPVSYNWQFGKEDVDEMLFMLQDAPHTVCRSTRLRSMFASRACR